MTPLLSAPAAPALLRAASLLGSSRRAALQLSAVGGRSGGGGARGFVALAFVARGGLGGGLGVGLGGGRSSGRSGGLGGGLSGGLGSGSTGAGAGIPSSGLGAGAGGALGGGAPARALYVKVTGNAGAALDRLQAKSELEGLERAAAARRRFVKPHLARQRSASDARYNRSKRERIRLVEEMVLDRRLVPF